MIVAFRTDASLKIGTGHVMRCLTLADALKARGAQCHFITRKSTGSLLDLIQKQGHETHLLSDSTIEHKSPTAHADWLEGDFKTDAEETRKILEMTQAEWLIVDHYALDATWEKTVKPGGVRLMAIDDLADRPHICSLLLDQNLSHTPDDYASLTLPECRCLVGPRYALVRPEFSARRATLKYERPNNWLACVGGLDPYDILGKIVSAWEKLPAPKPPLTLVVGSGSPNVEMLKQRAAALTDVTLHVQSADMANLMAEAGLFIGATGGISWERCCLGLPSIMGMVAENQRPNLEALARRETGVSIGDWREISVDALVETFRNVQRRPELLRKMAKHSAQLVDGKGAERVAVALMLDKIKLRKAKPADAELALAWRNAEETRRFSFDAGVIDPQTHKDWWSRSLANEKRSLLIAEIGGCPVGVLRLDHEGEDSTVSIYIDPALAGVGLGTAILRAGISWCPQNHWQTSRLLADIMAENRASQAAFQKAGFVFENPKWVYVL